MHDVRNHVAGTGQGTRRSRSRYRHVTGPPVARRPRHWSPAPARAESRLYPALAGTPRPRENRRFHAAWAPRGSRERGARLRARIGAGMLPRHHPAPRAHRQPAEARSRRSRSKARQGHRELRDLRRPRVMVRRSLDGVPPLLRTGLRRCRRHPLGLQLAGGTAWITCAPPPRGRSAAMA